MNKKTTKWVEDALCRYEREQINAKRRVTYHKNLEQKGVNAFIRNSFLAFVIIGTVGIPLKNHFDNHTWTFRSPLVVEDRTSDFHSPLTVSASETHEVKEAGQEAQIKYPYQDKVIYMDSKQKEVMKQIEDMLGSGYAELIFRESGFHPTSVNSIGACGLGQALPCVKMPCELTDVSCQLDWIKSYVERRYGTIEKALAFHDENGWY